MAGGCIIVTMGFRSIDRIVVMISSRIAVSVRFGRVRIVMIVALGIQWCLSLPLNWFFGVYLGFGLFGMLLNGFFMVLIRTGIFTVIWNRERWSLIKI